MKLPIRSYLPLFTLVGFSALTLVTSGCGAQRADATDTKTNWLSSCNGDSDCNNDLACLCGVCTASCDSTGECGTFDRDARCFDVSHCGAASAVCALSEDDLRSGGTDTDASAETTGSVTPDPSTLSSTLDTTTQGETGTQADSDTTISNAQTTQTESDRSASDAGVNTADCREESLYTALGERCEVVDFDCAEGEVTFVDQCGCGCEPNLACDPELDYLAYGEACNLIDTPCEDGQQEFRDECGCGCVTPVDDVDGRTAEACPAPPAGTPIDTIVLAEGACIGDFAAQWVTSQEQLDAALADCGIQVSNASFDGNLVYIGSFSDRTTARFGFAVNDQGVIHIGLESDAYCGGAAPPDSVVVLQLNGITGARLVDHYCTIGECSGLPVP